MQKTVFSKHWSKTGFTFGEAVRKIAAVEAAHGVGTPRSKWGPAVMVADERGGYKIVISTKS